MVALLDGTKLVQSYGQVKQLVSRIKKFGAFAYDSESTGLHVIRDRIILHVFTLPDEATYLIPVRMLTVDCLDPKKVATLIRSVFRDAKIEKVFHNAKIDWHFLTNDGVQLNNYYDTMVAGWMWDENEPNSLKERCKHVGIDDHSKFSWATYFTSRRMFAEGTITPKRRVDLEQQETDMLAYAAKDGIATWRLGEYYKGLMAGEPVLERVLNKVWLPFIEVLYDMERTGMCVDLNFFRRARIKCRQLIDEAEKEVYAEAGKVFNIASSKQLAEVLYEDMAVPVKKLTKKGVPSTDKDTLSLLAMEGATSAAYGTRGFISAFPIVEVVLAYKKYKKIYDAYLKEESSMYSRIHQGRLHTSYNAAGTGTGRLASSNPNLQVLPNADDDHPDLSIRKGIVAPRGYALIVADFSQFELRVIADRTGDPEMCAVYNTGDDIHNKTQTALVVVRLIAKRLNFGAFYDVQPNRFSTILTVASGTYVSPRECEKHINGLFTLYAEVPRYKQKVYRRCRKKGYVNTYLGRRRRLPDMRSPDKFLRMRAERQAFNAEIQGSVADIMNLCMLRFYRSDMKKRLQMRMVGQVHDEVHFIVKKSVLAKVGFDHIKEGLKDIFEHPFPKGLKVPIEFNVEDPVTRWGDAK